MNARFTTLHKHIAVTALGLSVMLASKAAMASPIAVPPPATSITGGITEVRLDAAPTLSSLGVSVGLLGSASLVSATGGIPIVDFPITGGSINPAVNPVPGVPAAQIEHVGSGLSFTAGTKVLKLEDFLIDTQSLTLFGKVDEAGTILNTVDLFTIGLNSDPTKGTYPFSLALTATAAGALNSYFGVTAFTAGLGIGVASTAPSTVPEPGSLALLSLGALSLLALRRRSDDITTLSAITA